jgi:hypothetical protein
VKPYIGPCPKCGYVPGRDEVWLHCDPWCGWVLCRQCGAAINSVGLSVANKRAGTASD